jgi:hypothetical protein
LDRLGFSGVLKPPLFRQKKMAKLVMGIVMEWLKKDRKF